MRHQTKIAKLRKEKTPAPQNISICKGALSPPIDYIKQLLALGRRRQVLVPFFGHQDAVLGAAPAHGVVPLHDIPLNEARVHGVLAEIPLQVRAVKVQARLDGENHTRAEGAVLLLCCCCCCCCAILVQSGHGIGRHHGTLATAVSRTNHTTGSGGGEHERQVAHDIVHLQPDVVSQPVREKGRHRARRQDLLARAAQDPQPQQPIHGHVARVRVDLVKVRARPHARDALVLHPRHDRPNRGRPRGQHAAGADGQRAGNVARVAAVLAPGVQHNRRAVPERRVVGAVVQRRAVGAGAGDDGVRLVVGVARGAHGLEDGLQLGLVGHAPDGPGDGAVGGAGDVVGAADEGNFVLVLDLARAVHGRLEGRGVNGWPIGGARAEGLVEDQLRGSLLGVEGVDGLCRRGKGGHVVGEVAGVVHLVGVVEAGGLGGGRGRAEPMALLGLGVGDP